MNPQKYQNKNQEKTAMLVSRFTFAIAFITIILVLTASLISADTNISGNISVSGFELPEYGNFGFLGINSTISFDGNIGENAYYMLSINAIEDISSNQESPIGLKEAYLSYSSGITDIYVGKQIVAWGFADGINPTDNINPRYIGTRYATDLDSLKIGATMLRIDIYPSDNTQAEACAASCFYTKLPAFYGILRGCITIPSYNDGR